MECFELSVTIAATIETKTSDNRAEAEIRVNPVVVEISTDLGIFGVGRM